jgi:hypothetical protein
MCCLGQFSEQAGKPLDQLLDQQIIPIGYPIAQLVDNRYMDRPSEFANEAIEINDCPCTTPAQKAAALQELFLKHGYTIELVNFPEEVLKEM